MSWDKEPGAKEFLQHAIDEMAPKLRGSAVALSILPSDGGPGDAKYWVELGASIMYEKPIILVVTEGCTVPQKLQKVADEIIVLPPGPIEPGGDAAEQLEEAFTRLLGDE